MKKGGEPGKDGGPAVSSLQEMVDKQVGDSYWQGAQCTKPPMGHKV